MSGASASNRLFSGAGAMNEFGRDLRVADFVRDELAQIIQREMRDPRVHMVNINDVKVSRDLSYADVYVSSLALAAQQGDRDNSADKKAIVTVLNKAAGFLRSQLAKRHSMRTTPMPRFHYDEIGERAPKLDALIRDALDADERQHAEQSGQDGDSDGSPA